MSARNVPIWKAIDTCMSNLYRESYVVRKHTYMCADLSAVNFCTFKARYSQIRETAQQLTYAVCIYKDVIFKEVN